MACDLREALAAGVNRPDRFVRTTVEDDSNLENDPDKPELVSPRNVVKESTWKQELKEIAVNSAIRMLFEELRALRPVRRASIKGGTKILRSHMFVVEKLLACGAFDKVKARLVADGRDQDATMYPNKSSPTVSVHSVYTVLGWVPNLKWCKDGKIDINGAFVQTPMTGESVYMQISPKIVLYIVAMFPEFEEFVEENGTMVVLMEKAMYGCVQASSLWFAFLTTVLKNIGYEQSPTDKCVMRKVNEYRIYLILIYVDDM